MESIRNSDASERRRGGGIDAYAIPVFVFLLGILLSVSAFVVERAGENEMVDLVLQARAKERGGAIKMEMAHIKDTVENLQSLFVASETVTRGEFAAFVAYDLRMHGSIQALEWIPRVPDSRRAEFEEAAREEGFPGFQFTEKNKQGEMVRAAKREEYFPVYYVEPLKGNEAAMGFDLASDKARLESLERSRDTGRTVATAKITLVLESTAQPGFLLFQPVYKKGVPLSTPEERREALDGFALGVYSIGVFIESALKDLPPVGIHLSVFDMSAPPGEEFLHHYIDQPELRETHEYPTDLHKAEKGPHYSENIEVGGRRWKMVFSPRPELIQSARTGRPMQFLLLGLALTGALAYVSSLLVSRNVKVRALVDERTQELREAREELEVRVQERTAELADSEERFRAINTTATDAIILIDNSGDILYWNPAAELMFGYMAGEALGKNMHSLITPERYHEKCKKGFDRFRETGHGPAIGVLLEFMALRKDGTEFPIEIAISALKIKGAWHAVGAIRDITERKKAEEEIRQLNIGLEHTVKERTAALDKSLSDTENARDRIDGILKAVADGLIVTDIYNRVILMNRAAEDLLGVRLSEVVDRPVDFAIKDATLREKVKETLEKKTTGYQFDFELPLHAPGLPRIMRARTSVIFDREGVQTGIVTIIHDVTHEREVDRMKTEFISTAAHELRTPLTSIRGFSEILLTRKDLRPEEGEKFLTYINEQAVKLGTIINDLLDLSRIESGTGFALQKAYCNAGDAIKQIVPYFEAMTDKHTFEVKLPEKPMELFVDKDKMGQVLKNILSNAVKYSPDGGVIKITGEVVDGNYHIAVEDQGMGMTPEQVAQVFKKFFRADTTDTAVEGTGLGMTIVKHIVEAHGGEVWVQSEYGKGTTVTFKIPIEATSNKEMPEEKKEETSS